MPWKEQDLATMREEFVLQARQQIVPFSTLCDSYGISRKTGYKWLKRYKAEGAVGLQDRARTPARVRSTEDPLIELILEARDEFPAWGARKLRQYLLNEGHAHLPSESTFNRILKKHGRIDPEESRKRTKFIRFERSKPMELLQMDFKGYFHTTEGRCHPLTVIDDHSRFALCLKSCAGERHDIVKTALTDLFREYGLPEAMTMDNGSPWKGGSNNSCSRLTVWLMRLGIRVSHSRPYHPQTQGKDERFHRTLKQEVLKYNNFQTLSEVQEAFDHWRWVYNYKRPHEGINMLRPCERYAKSPRQFPEVLPPVDYSSRDEVRLVQRNGSFVFRGHRIYIGEHLHKERVAIREAEESGVYDIYYVKTRLRSARLMDLPRA